MQNNLLFKIIALVIILTSLTSCGSNIFRRADVKAVPINVNERVKKNVEEGRGIRFGKGGSQGGVFDFASSNELWRASIEVLDFVPFTNASYSGGILITEWFDGGSNDNPENKRNLKITVRFLTNEIRSDAVEIKVFNRKCSIDLLNCRTVQTDGVIVLELKKKILKLAAVYEEEKNKK